MTLILDDYWADKAQTAIAAGDTAGALAALGHATTATVEDATRIIRADYYADVKDVADSLREAVKSGEVTTEDAAFDYLADSIDGHSRVIYTYQAKLGLLASDNEDAYDGEVGESGATPEVRMYYALRQDVMDELGSLDSLFPEDEDDEAEDSDEATS